MAINVEALVARGPYEGDDFIPQPIEITGPEAVLMIREKIERVVNYGKKPFKLFRDPGLARSDLFLLSEEGGYIYSMDSEHPGFSLPVLELQKEGIAVMQEFGFNPDLFEVTSLQRFDNGIASEGRIYRSQSVRRLEFARSRYYFQETEKLISVEWQAHWRF